MPLRRTRGPPLDSLPDDEDNGDVDKVEVDVEVDAPVGMAVAGDDTENAGICAEPSDSDLLNSEELIISAGNDCCNVDSIQFE